MSTDLSGSPIFLKREELNKVAQSIGQELRNRFVKSKDRNLKENKKKEHVLIGN